MIMCRLNMCCTCIHFYQAHFFTCYHAVYKLFTLNCTECVKQVISMQRKCVAHLVHLLRKHVPLGSNHTILTV